MDVPSLCRNTKGVVYFSLAVTKSCISHAASVTGCWTITISTVNPTFIITSVYSICIIGDRRVGKITGTEHYHMLSARCLCRFSLSATTFRQRPSWELFLYDTEYVLPPPSSSNKMALLPVLPHPHLTAVQAYFP